MLYGVLQITMQTAMETTNGHDKKDKKDGRFRVLGEGG